MQIAAEMVEPVTGIQRLHDSAHTQLLKTWHVSYFTMSCSTTKSAWGKHKLGPNRVGIRCSRLSGVPAINSDSYTTAMSLKRTTLAFLKFCMTALVIKMVYIEQQKSMLSE